MREGRGEEEESGNRKREGECRPRKERRRGWAGEKLILVRKNAKSRVCQTGKSMGKWMDKIGGFKNHCF